MCRVLPHTLLALLLATLTLPAQAAPRPVFPGAQGFGSDTPAGRGGAVLKVTTLADSGPGSLREALAQNGPRTVVFEVGGTILLAADLEIRAPFVTVAGQSAPPPGITLRGAGLRVLTHDVLIRHLRIRVGDAPGGPPPQNRDALQVLGPEARRVVIDHVSASWAIDELFSTWYPVRDVTLSHSILSEALQRSLHPKGPHSMGVLIGPGGERVALIGNLVAHTRERQPRVSGAASVLLVNNLFYNGGAAAQCMIGSADGPSRLAALGNLFLPGPDSPPAMRPFQLTGSARPGTRVYLADNRGADGMSADGLPARALAPAPPFALPELTVRPAAAVEAWVLAQAGARPRQRDAVDARVAAQVTARGGRIVDTPAQAGGWPADPESRRSFVVPADPHGDADGDGYTNLEELLEGMARELEKAL